MTTAPSYKRILLKISGESLSGDQGFGIIPEHLIYVAKEIKSIHDLGVEVGVVVGGGNIYRGSMGVEIGIERAAGDYMGMLATVINSLALQANLENIDIPTRVLTALKIDAVAEPYIRRRAIRHLEKKRVVIMAAGTGNPYFTTDTAAALRAIEIGADIILKATKVDGIYSSDPFKDKDAVKYNQITYNEAINKDLRIMDGTAFTLCRENNMPIVVFKLNDSGSLKKFITGEKIGTSVTA